MTSEPYTHINLELTWPETLEIPKGTKAYATLWVGNEATFYRDLLDADASAPVTASPTTLEVAFDPAHLHPDAADTTWGYLHATAYLVSNGKRITRSRLHKRRVGDNDTWKIELSAL
ncbi:hypothetical protein [Pseudomonas fontis]|uniref:Uncharacterized protein n=1 Tax=Pseudomonas fontis TaxID=2942633 RepID=A0ABT5NUH1_9PSED|nr:hypothetical protein [Pseudomonas fontis]MDD0976929.1 hypothetical protein [Pseudomonas fontis]MDD0991824.1 hypothetical protein [Pseudomonas fontis]